MKIEVHTSNAMQLWDKIKKYIVDEKIKTWSIVQDTTNRDFLTHNPPQWFRKALLVHSLATNRVRLILTVTWFANSEPIEYIKGLYIGRFTEELLEHFKSDFIKLETFA